MDAFSNLGIEWWSVLLYLVNIFLLVAVLTWILYKPVVKIMDQRRKTIADSMEEAERLKQSFEETAASMKQEKKEMQVRFDLEMKAGKKALEEEKKKLIAEIEAKRVSVHAELDQERERLVSEVKKELLTSMEKMVIAVIGDVASKEAVSHSAKETFDSLFIAK